MVSSCALTDEARWSSEFLTGGPVQEALEEKWTSGEGGNLPGQPLRGHGRAATCDSSNRCATMRWIAGRFTAGDASAWRTCGRGSTRPSGWFRRIQRPLRRLAPGHIPTSRFATAVGTKPRRC